MTSDKIGIIGLGLIGGTIAKTIHRVYPQTNIVAYDQNMSSLDSAAKEGVIHTICRGNFQDFSDCNYVFLCAPVIENETFLQSLHHSLSAKCILTDTGSVKSAIFHDVDRLGWSARFIGGHPMAGSEKNGYENATPYLFENAYYILTPAAGVAPEQVTAFRDFLASLGCLPLIMLPDEHDYITAAVSHLPHILAASLVNLIQELDQAKGTMKTIAAGGFKDITRIASSSPTMWQEICLANQKEVTALLSAFIRSLKEIQGKIESGQADEIFDFFKNAKDYRDSLPIASNGSIPVVYELYCDLIDEAGGIATIATILASNHISIKNIGIIHNREFEEGVLHIEFYEEPALLQSILLLKKYHYTLYER
jgi:prephenate dehydrogenase